MSLVSGLLHQATSAINRVGRALRPAEAAWKGAACACLVMFLVLAGVFGFFAVVPDFWIGKVLGYAVLIGIVVAVVLGVLVFYWLLAIQPPGHRVFSLLAVLTGGLYGLVLWELPGGLIPPLILVLLLSVTFGSLASLRSGGRQPFSGLPALIGLGAGIVGLVGVVWMIVQPVENINPWLDAYVFDDRTLALPDPGMAGTYAVGTFTYGSGGDLHRPEFAADVTYKTKSVDGSKLVDRWEGSVGWARTRYWGFDSSALPVQGRVWMPKGEGPFPLVLMVHGNHDMEDFSDPGYGYLGRHFASHGMVAVSVDENFLNSSNADLINPISPGIGKENDARGWMLLKHLTQWRDWTGDPTHPLAGKVDMARLALIGHSRGGEAVAVAAAFNTLDHYPDDASETFDFDFNIRGFIAIAPADGQYNPRKHPRGLEDINYFVIHGSMDGDVQSFMGASQFSRIGFTGTKKAIKASLYVEGANHGQFNTSWGRYDYGLPMGWLFNTKDIMDAKDQRRIARVYFTAFLETAMNDREDYLPLLSDPRNGAAWLPDQYMLANLVTADRQVIANYEEDMEVSSTTFGMAGIDAQNLTKWREEWTSLKWNTLDTHVVILAWDGDVEEDIASYGFEWTAGSLKLGEASTFVFAAADAGEGTKPKGWESPDGAEEEDSDDPQGLDWTLVLTDVYGNEARLALSHDAPLYPQVKAHTRKLERFASIDKSELVWRRFAFPVRDFIAANPDLQPTALVGLRFEFDKSEAGAIAIDDFGIE